MYWEDDFSVLLVSLSDVVSYSMYWESPGISFRCSELKHVLPSGFCFSYNKSEACTERAQSMNF